MTTVISVRGRKPAELLADPSFVYVGRPCGPWRGSIWGNPFKVAEYGGQALALFDLCIRAALGQRPWPVAVHAPDAAFRRMAERLPELRGKTLGCWCGSWQPGEPEIGCHAVSLAKLADALPE